MTTEDEDNMDTTNIKEWIQTISTTLKTQTVTNMVDTSHMVEQEQESEQE